MTVTDEQRHRLYEWVEQSGGKEVAATLMGLLPPVGWADVATKHDMDREHALLRSAMNHGFAELRGEMTQGFAQLRGEMSEGFADLRVEIHRNLRTQLYWLLGFMVTIQGAFAALTQLD